ncbi:MAG: hypothetical protein LV481_10615 [Methylacidiphilales bacterium]|nr:hypothetical protein [Candidatus Methylacidiphilales bacterium]
MPELPDNAYDQLLVSVFESKWRSGLKEITFTKDDLIDADARLGLRIKNLADVLYTYRSRRAFPAHIAEKGNWIIAAKGSGKYAFVKVTREALVEIPSTLKIFPIPYAVPEIVASNLADDEQGLLTIVRYNRLLDVFTGLACFHLQSHIRTHVKGHGQIEIDELYVGVDKDGRGYALPVEGKVAGESLGIDKAVGLTLFASAKFPNLICRPVAVLRQARDIIACVEFEPASDIAKVSVLDIRRYQLVREERKPLKP